MPVLQRSCRACASAKRQCDLIVPRCGRCSSRNIACKYVNQPGALESGSWGASHERRGQKPDAVERALGSLQSIIGRRLQIYNPLRLEVIRTFDSATVQQQISVLKSLPVVYARCGANAFIHQHLYSSQPPSHLSEISSIVNISHTSDSLDTKHLPTSRSLKLKVRQLLYMGARASSYEELVSCVQALVLVQIARLSQDDDPGTDDPEHDNAAIWTLSHRLWEQAPIQLPSALSPWRAWVFAESVRRTLLVCNILIGVYGVLRRGYAAHALCIEALPFDMRTELWDAGTEGSWEGAVCTADGESLPLVSFRQFISLQRSASDRSPFETLLRLSFQDSRGDEAQVVCPVASQSLNSMRVVP